MSFLDGWNPFSAGSSYGLAPNTNYVNQGRSAVRRGVGLDKPGATPGPRNMYGIDTTSSTYAGDTYAALTRDQWQTYVSTFVPLENQLIDYATDPNKPMEAMAKVSQNVQSAFDMQQGATKRQLGGLGVSLNADETAAQERSFGLSKALADVGAQNMAGALTRQRQQAILGNPAPQAATSAITGG